MFLQEKMKSKNKLVPRLLGITKESVMRVDERTKEVVQEWPLTTVKRWAASPKSFTLVRNSMCVYMCADAPLLCSRAVGQIWRGILLLDVCRTLGSTRRATTLCRQLKGSRFPSSLRVTLISSWKRWRPSSDTQGEVLRASNCCWSFIDHWSSLIHPNGLSTHCLKLSLTGVYFSSNNTYLFSCYSAISSLSCIINCVFFCFLQKQSKDRFGLEGDEESTMLEESVSPKKCVKI